MDLVYEDFQVFGKPQKSYPQTNNFTDSNNNSDVQ